MRTPHLVSVLRTSNPLTLGHRPQVKCLMFTEYNIHKNTTAYFRFFIYTYHTVGSLAVYMFIQFLIPFSGKLPALANAEEAD